MGRRAPRLARAMGERYSAIDIWSYIYERSFFLASSSSSSDSEPSVSIFSIIFSSAKALGPTRLLSPGSEKLN